MSETLAGVLALAAAFALGSLPSAYIAGRALAGVDLREIGSGNPGALNAGDRLGKAVGALVFLADAGKGVLAVALAQRLTAGDGWVYASALTATAGHNFSPFLRFRGGKGAATALGVLGYTLPGITALSAVSGALMLAATRKPVASVGWTLFSMIVLTVGMGRPAGQTIMCAALSALVVGTHFARSWDDVKEAAAARDWRRFMEIN